MPYFSTWGKRLALFFCWSMLLRKYALYSAIFELCNCFELLVEAFWRASLILSSFESFVLATEKPFEIRNINLGQRLIKSLKNAQHLQSQPFYYYVHSLCLLFALQATQSLLKLCLHYASILFGPAYQVCSNCQRKALQDFLDDLTTLPYWN